MEEKTTRESIQNAWIPSEEVKVEPEIEETIENDSKRQKKANLRMNIEDSEEMQYQKHIPAFSEGVV